MHISVGHNDVYAALGNSRGEPPSQPTVLWAIQVATGMVYGYLRTNFRDGLPLDATIAARPIVISLACRLATNPQQHQRVSYEVEGSSYSVTPAPGWFTLADHMVLRRYRRTTA